MAFTRFHDDPARIRKQLEETTFTCQYQLDRPGNEMTYESDPNIRLQFWGANLLSNTITLENELRRNLAEKSSVSKIAHFPVSKPFVEESRASHPAWMYRSMEQSKWEVPILNPLFVETPFQTNIQTRILEKDAFCRR